MSAVAFPDAGLCEIGHFLRTAVRASHFAIGPAKLYHQLAAVLEVLKVNNGFLQCLYAFHAINIRLFLRYVKYIIALTKPEQGGNAAMVAAQAVMHVATESAV